MSFRIPVEIASDGIPYVIATVQWRRRRTTAPIRFLLDTGAHDIALSSDDAEKLRAPIEELPRSRHPVGGIGGEVNSYDLPGVGVGFAGSRGRRLEFWLRPVRVIGNPEGMPGAVRRTYVPSLLGRAFLRKGRFVLSYDFGADAAFLEIKETPIAR